MAARTRMTLATIFLFSMLWTTGSASADPALAQQSTPAQDTQTQSPNPTPQDQSTSTGTKPSNSKPTAKKKSPASSSPHLKPKKTSAGCTSSSTASPAGSGTKPGDTATPSGQSSTTTTSAGNCPPPKIVVVQGGTSEPSVELAGGQGSGQSNQERATANQMLETTESNLKKLGERSLSATEQQTVAQVRQFLSESKTAAAGGDMERARTLAWKAQVLSEDLVKPPE